MQTRRPAATPEAAEAERDAQSAPPAYDPDRDAQSAPPASDPDEAPGGSGRGVPGRDAASADSGARNRALLAWYRASGRAFPARDTRDPWRLLVFEVMSHQTQLPRALEALEPFLSRFPLPASLAAASRGDVLRAWAGLGYNRRALGLRAAAIEIVERHAGRVPEDVEQLDALPGVGPYTARAVAAQAFDIAAGPVDVNVRRVLGRWIGQELRPRAMQALADALAEPAAPGAWVHAVMDLAALICLPRGPRCGECPVRNACTSADRVEPQVRRRPTRPAQPFPSTRRWLRGALVRELRAAPPGAWIDVSGARGTHAPARVREALQTLARDGLVEIGEGETARLPIE